MLWDCEQCGTKGIAGSLEECPVCKDPRPGPPAGEPNLSEEGDGTPTPAGAGEPAGEEEDGATSGSQDSDSPQASPGQPASSEVPSAGGFLAEGNWT